MMRRMKIPTIALIQDNNYDKDVENSDDYDDDNGAFADGGARVNRPDSWVPEYITTITNITTNRYQRRT